MPGNESRIWIIDLCHFYVCMYVCQNHGNFFWMECKRRTNEIRLRFALIRLEMNKYIFACGYINFKFYLKNEIKLHAFVTDEFFPANRK